MELVGWCLWLLFMLACGFKVGNYFHAMTVIHSCESCGAKVHYLSLHKLNYGYDEVNAIKVCPACYDIRFRWEIWDEGK